MTIRPHQGNPESGPPRVRAGVASILALVLLASLVLASGAVASSPRKAKAAAANPQASASVVGGHATEVADFPALAYIEGVQATAGYACSGTVVAPRVVLTAGHCVEDLESSSIVEPSEIRVATGISNLTHIPTEKISRVSKVLVYPHFDPALLHGDAGLLILSAPVTAKPIALAKKAEASLYNPGRQLTVSGWGVNEPRSNHIPHQLQAAKVPIQESSRCEDGVARFYLFYDPDRQLCTLDSPNFQITPCHGDSGGPAIATTSAGTQVEVGVVSMGEGSCAPSSPAVYTRVDQISGWVHHWIEAVENDGTPPKVKIPKAHIPSLTRERAEELSFIVLSEALGGRFIKGQEQAISCERQGKARLKCGLSWYQGPNDYYSRVNVFFAIRHNVVLVGAHYAVHWVNDQCYFEGADPASCQIHSKKS